MSKFIINGGTSLEGDIEIGGAKNAALKMIAAALLTDQSVRLTNVPEIKDIESLSTIMVKLGAKVQFKRHTMDIDCSGVSEVKLDVQLVKHLRGSVVLIGPLLARFGNVITPQPGGCLIGSRPIDTHVQALVQLGAQVKLDGEFYHFEAKKLIGNKVVLSEMSVTATENILMAATLAEGNTEIRLAASEPEIEDLAVLLVKMGADIKGAGTSVIKVKGVQKLNGAEHEVIPDRIEAGTFAVAAAVSRGNVRIHNVNPDHLDIVIQKLKAANVNVDIEDSTILHVRPTTMFSPVQIDTRPHPGFPTDLQAPFSVLLTQANGMSKIFETLYEGRLGYVKELAKMGADMKITDAHTVVINGPTPLYGKDIVSFDIRAGATLIIAAIIAEGKSTIDNIELVDRGYEKIDEQLSKLGASIKRVD